MRDLNQGKKDRKKPVIFQSYQRVSGTMTNLQFSLFYFYNFSDTIKRQDMRGETRNQRIQRVSKVRFSSLFVHSSYLLLLRENLMMRQEEEGRRYWQKESVTQQKARQTWMEWMGIQKTPGRKNRDQRIEQNRQTQRESKNREKRNGGMNEGRLQNSYNWTPIISSRCRKKEKEGMTKTAGVKEGKTKSSRISSSFPKSKTNVGK